MTIRQVQRSYDRLRARYFMDAEAPLRVPPPAAELRWAWLPRRCRAHGYTHFDQDGDPDLVEVDPALQGSRFMTWLLLHELTHMRAPGLSCGTADRPGPGWRQEMARLARMGAPLL